MGDTKIVVKDLNLYYGENHALKNVNMDIAESIIIFVFCFGQGNFVLFY